MAGKDVDPKLSDVEPVDPLELKLDQNNPRLAELEFNDENDLIRHFIKEYDVTELVLSILSAGWLDYEPLIVERKSNTVIEGNRRLAALKLICDEAKRNELDYVLPEIENEHANAHPSNISVRYVDERSDAYVYVGFKHINGPFKWDSLAKAKFASEWIAEGHPVEVVSRTLGDSNNTIVRLVSGWNVLKRATEFGFDAQQSDSIGQLPISHLYTALTRPDFRNFLGIEKSASKIIEGSDVPKDHSENLTLAMSWLYGQRDKGEKSVIRSQNPDLGKLVRTIANESAFEELVATRDLDRAFELLTAKNHRFEIALRKASQAAEGALAEVKNYDGSGDMMEVVTDLGKTVITLRSRMQASISDPLAELGTDASKS